MAGGYNFPSITVDARIAHEWLISQGWKIDEKLSHPTRVIYTSPRGKGGTGYDLECCVKSEMLHKK